MKIQLFGITDYLIFGVLFRNTALGSCSLTARVGGIAAPWLAFFLPKVIFREGPKDPLGEALRAGLSQLTTTIVKTFAGGHSTTPPK